MRFLRYYPCITRAAVKCLLKKQVEFNEMSDKIHLTKDERTEVQKIVKFLDADEKVLFVATQSRIARRWATVSPSTIFATDRKMIIRNATVIGSREGFRGLREEQDIAVIPYDGVIAMNPKKEMFSSEVKAAAADLPSRSSRLTVAGCIIVSAPMSKDKTHRFASIVEEGIKGTKETKAVSTPLRTAGPTPLKGLQNFKRRKGILQSKKKTTEKNKGRTVKRKRPQSLNSKRHSPY